MIKVFTASAATENGPDASNGKVVTGDPASVARCRFTVVGATWTGTIKVLARIIGQGQRLGLGTADADFVNELAIINLNDGTVIDGDTGVAADGVYEVDISGFECVFQHTRVAGSVTVVAHVVAG